MALSSSGVDSLVQLESVVEETRTYGIRGEEGSLAGWGWEQKETDIYKVSFLPLGIRWDTGLNDSRPTDSANSGSFFAGSRAPT